MGKTKKNMVVDYEEIGGLNRVLPWKNWVRRCCCVETRKPYGKKGGVGRAMKVVGFSSLGFQYFLFFMVYKLNIYF